MPFVVLGTDFLSAFLKIEQLPLIRQFYRVDAAYITPAIYQELAQTTLLPLLLNGFLHASKFAGMLDHQQLRRIIDDLWQKDYYKFSQEITNLLLSK